jgi:hypothetical protein
MADNIAALLAGAAKTNANFNFDELGKSYWAGLDEAYKRRTQDAFLNAQSDASLLDDKGQLDPSKVFSRAVQVGGVPAALNADKLAEGAYKIGGYRNAQQLEDPSSFPPSLNRSAPAPTSRTPGPTSYANPNDDPQSAVAPGPKQPTLKDVFTASGVAPSAKNYSDASAAIQLATGKPFDPNGPIDLNNPAVRQAVAPFVRSQQPTQLGPAAQSQPQPQAVGSDPQVQSVPGSGVPLSMQLSNQAVPARFPTPQQGGQPAPAPQMAPAAIQQQFPASVVPPGPQTMTLSPEAMKAMAQAQPQGQQQSGLIDPESLRQMIPSDILRAGGGTVAGTLNLLSQIKNSRVPADRKAGYVKLYDDLTKQLELNDAQRNALSSGQPNPLAYDINKANTTELGKQDIDTFNKRNIPIQAAAQMSYDGIQKAKLMKQLTLDPNFYSGPLNQNVQTYNQFKAIFGQNPSSAVPMEAFNKVANDMLTEQIKALGQSGAGRVMLAEVNNMKASVAGLGITPQTNRVLAEIVQRVYAKSQHIADIANNVPQTPGKMNRTLDTQIQGYLQKNPMFTPEELRTPALLGAPDTPSGSERWSPGQARAWGAKIGLKPGDPIRVDGKIRAIP